ncbi:ATP-dependent zinc metalloprotease FtsH [Pseudobdellovibrio sp. HCB154]|uniref:ATP-dependent zinc metalloprotease FtsH n=1 Tax=Pseudobdellovibrio sp. HCB154 TaxID=3386277 RepID=UPI0039174C91
MQDDQSKLPKPGENKLNFGVMFLILMAMVIFNNFFFRSRAETVPYSEFLQMVEKNQITNVVISESNISGEIKSDDPKNVKFFSTNLVNDETLVQKLHDKNITFRSEFKDPFWRIAFAWLIPIIFIYFLFNLAARGMTRGAGGILSLTKSRAKIYMEKTVKTTFSDVAGVDEAKDELAEVVNFLQDPQRYSRLGGRAPKGVLLVGPPGTGKTLLARAVAGEAKVTFFSINGSEFVEMFVGLGAARVRDLFDQARSQAPCLLFIDEIDALGKSRAFGAIGSGGNDEKEQTLNQLLAEMDGFDTSEGVIMIAATNRPEILDPALLRAGRFDRQILLSPPDQVGRLQILKVHAKRIILDPKLDLNHIASLTSGFSGADLANLINEAAIVATRRNADFVTEDDFTQAIERLVAGLEKKSKVMSEKEKTRIAYHEMGHATVGLALSTTDKVHKVSIIPRGMGALGYTIQRPTEDRYVLDEDELLDKIAVLLGGRCSEEIFCEKISTGASDDLAKATDLARAMVTQFGMSQKIGMVTLENKRSAYLQGQFEGNGKLLSDRTASDVDEEVRNILDKSFARATECLTRNKNFIFEAVKVLRESETLNEPKLMELWKQYGKPRIHNPPQPLPEKPLDH